MGKGNGGTRATTQKEITRQDILASLSGFGYGYDMALTQYLNNPESNEGRFSILTEEDKKNFEAEANIIDKAFTELPLKQGRYYRGLAFDSDAEFQNYLNQIKSGVIKDKAFAYVDTERDIANGYSKGGRYSVLVTYDNVKALPISEYNDGSAEEHELLLPRKTKYRVTDYFYNYNDNRLSVYLSN